MGSVAHAARDHEAGGRDEEGGKEREREKERGEFGREEEDLFWAKMKPKLRCMGGVL